MINPMELTDKKILVAGASGTLGKAIVKQIKALGADVIVLSRDSEKMRTVLSEIECDDVPDYTYDYNELTDIKSVISKIAAEQGKLDGFVYAVGVMDMIPLRALVPEKLEAVMNVNYNAFVEFVRCISQKSCSNDGACIIGISSIASLKGERAKLAYSSSKAAMDAAVRCMAHELTPKRGIRVNAIQPAGINVGGYVDYLEDNKDSDYVKAKIERQFAGLIEPQEVANLTAFLLSDATKTITGNSIKIDAGCLV